VITLEKEEDIVNLYKVGNDALFSVTEGVYEIEFQRKAYSLKEAVMSALYDLSKIQDLHVVEVKHNQLYLN
jgi:hypothetical protein